MVVIIITSISKLIGNLLSCYYCVQNIYSNEYIIVLGVQWWSMTLVDLNI